MPPRPPAVTPPARRRPPGRQGGPVTVPTPDLAELRAELEALRAELRPLPDRLNALAKSGDAQRKRVEALAAAEEKRARELLRRLEERSVGRSAGAAWRRLARRARALLQSRGATAPVEGAKPPAAPPPSPPAVNWVLAGGARVAPGARAVLVALFGLGEAEREEVVRRLAATTPAASPPLLPVFLTDSSDFTPMRRAHALFEHLPLCRGGGEPGTRRDWPLYLVRRFAGLCAKWQPVQVVAFGPVAARQLVAWRASPHLPEAVRDLLAVEDETGGWSPAPPQL